MSSLQSLVLRRMLISRDERMKGIEKHPPSRRTPASLAHGLLKETQGEENGEMVEVWRKPKDEPRTTTEHKNLVFLELSAPLSSAVSLGL